MSKTNTSKVVAGGKGSVKLVRTRKIKGLRNKRKAKLAKIREEETKQQRYKQKKSRRRKQDRKSVNFDELIPTKKSS